MNRLNTECLFEKVCFEWWFEEVMELGQRSSWDCELDGGREPEWAHGCVDVEQVGAIQKGKVVHGLTCEKKDFSEGREFNREPMKPPQDRCDVTDIWRSCGQQSVEPVAVYGWICQVNQKKVVTVVKVGRDECVELRFICIAVEFHVVWLKKIWKV